MTPQSVRMPLGLFKAVFNVVGAIQHGHHHFQHALWITGIHGVHQNATPDALGRVM